MDVICPSAPPLALCLGGMDPSGGAGLLRDALTLSELGCQPMAVSLAETLQNGLACLRIEAPAMDPVQRLEALAPHLGGRWGVKLSLCALEAKDFRRLCTTLRHLAPPIRIWDPILAPSAGVGLHDGGDLRRMAADLLPMGGLGGESQPGRGGRLRESASRGHPHCPGRGPRCPVGWRPVPRPSG